MFPLVLGAGECDIGDVGGRDCGRCSVRSNLDVVREECVYSFPCVSIWRGGGSVWWEAVLLPYRDMGLFSCGGKCHICAYVCGRGAECQDKTKHIDIHIYCYYMGAI